MNLKECILKIDKELNFFQKEEIKNSTKHDLVRYSALLRWIRNECDLWSYGTDNIESDIQLLTEKDYYIETVIELFEEKLKQQYDIDYNLEHPVNCSLVILDIYQDFLLDRFQISLLD